MKILFIIIISTATFMMKSDQVESKHDCNLTWKWVENVGWGSLNFTNTCDIGCTVYYYYETIESNGEKQISKFNKHINPHYSNVEGKSFRADRVSNWGVSDVIWDKASE